MTLLFDFTPVFAALTVLVAVPALAFAVAAVRSRRRRGRAVTRLVPRVETRSAAEPSARSA